MTGPLPLRPTFALAALALLAAGAGCKARTSYAGALPAPQGIVVQVHPDTARVAAGRSIQFTATVTGTSDGRVAWSTDAGAGSIDPGGVFTAASSLGDHVIRATSLADGTTSGTAAVTIYAPTSITVTVTPSPAAVDACQTVQFAATLQNATSSAVTWSVQEAAGGTVDTNGLYHAPSTPGTYHVVATSVEDPAQTSATPVTVSEHVLSVTVSPSSVTLSPGQTQQFAATITTSCGTTTAVTSVTAPLDGTITP
jgi:uncharacterized protein YjdB